MLLPRDKIGKTDAEKAIQVAAMDKIRKARTQLILDYPFFGSLVMRLEPVPCDAVPTAGTDGTLILYNPADFARRDLSSVAFIMAHEVMHCVLQTPYRLGDREPDTWNAAADFAINPILADSGLTMPQENGKPEGLIDPKFHGWSAEQIYEEIHDPNQPPPQALTVVIPPEEGNQDGQGSGSGDGDGQNEGQGGGNTPQDWQVAAQQAAQAAKNAGKLPGSLAALIEAQSKPSVDWREVLRHFVQRSAKNDYNMLPPSRRYLSRGMILPSLTSDELGEIVIIVDTSGSVWCDPGLPEQFASEISGILEDYDPSIHVVYVDYDVMGHETLTRQDLPIKLSARGGGGTSFCPGFDWIADQGIQPACAIYLTDLYGECPKYAPEYPVIWACVTDEIAPWGETIKVSKT